MKRNFDDPLYKEWRRRVLKRDKNKCQMPSCRRKKRLQVHHIQRWADNPYMRYDEDNGISLCWDCHNQVNGHELLYEGLFMEIVRANKNG